MGKSAWPIDFESRWGDSMDRHSFRLSDKDFVEMNLVGEVQDTLAKVRIPEWSAPNFHLHPPQTGIGSRRITIGEDRDANIVFLDRKNGEVRWTRKLESQEDYFLNGSLIKLLLALYHYQGMVEEGIAIAGEDAFINNILPAESIQSFRTSLLTIDNLALAEKGSFWTKELARLSGGIS